MNGTALPRRYLCLWLPFLTSDRWRRKTGADDNRPLVFVEKERGASRLVALDHRARALGLRTGMALADARALLPRLRVFVSKPAADAAYLDDLAELAQAFTPSIALDLPDGLLLDVTGCAHLFQGEHSMAARLRNTLREAGVSAVKLAVAPTPDMARALARFSRKTPCFVFDDELVRTLTVAALECDHDDTLALKRAGLKTIADVADRPSVLFTARFTAAFPEKLARVMGETDRRITPLRTLPPCRAERSCPEPVVSHDVIARIVSELATKVSEDLQTRGEGGRAFAATFMRADGVIFRVCVETSHPTRDPAVLMRLYRDRLDTLADPLDPGFGFDVIRFQAMQTELLAECQTTLDARDETNSQLTQLIDRLSIIFRPERVMRLQPVDSHIPERAQAMVPAGIVAASNAWTSCAQTGERRLRPPLIFAHPHPIEVQSNDEDETPSSLSWRRVMHRLTHAEGPERIADEWWRAPSGFGTRDYYRVQSANGSRFWIFRAEATEAPGQRHWFLHGLFP
jgi:protein ImuB